MATKLKNLIKDNYKAKSIFLFLTFLFLSICFESCFNLKYNFIGKNEWDFVNIQKFYFIGNVENVYASDIYDDYMYISIFSFLFSILFYRLYKINVGSNNNFYNRTNEFLKKIQIDPIILLLVVFVLLRFIEWGTTSPFYDSALVIYDTLILLVSCSLYKYMIIHRKNLKDKFSTYKFLKNLFAKHRKNSLKKRAVQIFSLIYVILFVLTFILLYAYENIFYNPFVLIIFLPLALSIPILYMYCIFSKKLDYLNELSESMKHIESGNLKYKLEVKGEDEISLLAKSINNITNGLENAVENQIKSEKMKTELITNVSHDLKTPLTSIVNYVDILKNNKLDEETTATYINILDKKTQRLKALVEDIFEASKINSGDIELSIEKTDIKELLIQSMVELEDKTSKSNLDFILDVPDYPIYTNIDGKKTFRVFENLIINIVKYSLNNTRVYIDMIDKDDSVIITLKNISNHRLNISSDELLERFRRGDVSRNTEGSGLGLSIAQSLVNLQNGKLDLNIDGDLFKVIIKFNTIN